MCLTFTVSGHLEPEFVDVVQNITVPVGRDVKFSCHVRHLGTSYKVSFSFRLFLFLYISIPFFLPFLFISKILSQVSFFVRCSVGAPKVQSTALKVIDVLDSGCFAVVDTSWLGRFESSSFFPCPATSLFPQFLLYPPTHPPIAVVHSPFRRCPSIQLAPLSQETLFPCLPLPVFC